MIFYGCFHCDQRDCEGKLKFKFKQREKKTNWTSTANMPHLHCQNDCADVCGDENVQFVELICNYTFVVRFHLFMLGGYCLMLILQRKYFWLQIDTECGLQFSASQKVLSIDCFVHTHIKIWKPPFSFGFCFLKYKLQTGCMR